MAPASDAVFCIMLRADEAAPDRDLQCTADGARASAPIHPRPRPAQRQEAAGQSWSLEKRYTTSQQFRAPDAGFMTLTS